MLDFVSSGYLGMPLGRAGLGISPALASLRPALLGGADLADRAAAGFAALQGRESGIAAASTLHLAADLFGQVVPPSTELHWDGHLYPVLRTMLPLAQPRMPPPLPPHDVGALAARLGRTTRRPILVTDGWCIECGKPAPLVDYLALLVPRRGILVVDDSQALGVMGDGGGTPRAFDIGARVPLLVLASLGKAFGVPMAVLSGPRSMLDRLRYSALSRIHCSPPAHAAAHSALR